MRNLELYLVHYSPLNEEMLFQFLVIFGYSVEVSSTVFFRIQKSSTWKPIEDILPLVLIDEDRGCHSGRFLKKFEFAVLMLILLIFKYINIY